MANTLSDSNTRERLLSVAVELFSEHGYQGVSVRDIARYMGLNPGFIYHHVESKQALLYELIEDTICDLIAYTKRHVSNKKTDLAKLQTFIEMFLLFNKSSPGKMLLASREEYNLTSQQKKEINSRYLEYIKILEQVLSPLISPQNRFRIPSLARTILAFLFGQLFLRDLQLPGASLVQFLTRLVLIESTLNSQTHLD